MKRSGVRAAVSASTSSVPVSATRLERSSKRCSETIPNGSSGSVTPAISPSGTRARLSRIVFEPVSTTSRPRRFDAAQAPGA